MLAQVIEAELRDVPPGARLGTRAEFRSRFQVAPATISETLRILETRSLITTRPGPGGGIFAARSRPVRLRDALLEFERGAAPYADCLVVRNALEPLVCREAALNCGPEDACEIRSIVDRMSLDCDNPKAFLLLGWELHRRVADMCMNVPLRSLYVTLLDYVEGGLLDVRAAEPRAADRDLAIHAELVEAIIGGTPQDLERAIERHTPVIDGAPTEADDEETVGQGVPISSATSPSTRR
jgi:DNA-binding FadR family transcriptional regulator